MISNVEKLHYLAVKKLSALLRGITSKVNRNFYCLNQPVKTILKIMDKIMLEPLGKEVLNFKSPKA